jgi:hypothetical protein
VLLGGEAGIGKSRLASEFAGHIPEARVLVRAEMTNQVRSGAVVGASGEYYEVTLAILRATEGRYDESETTYGRPNRSRRRFATRKR